MDLPDGPTLLGIAAIITSVTGLITAFRRSSTAPTTDGTTRQRPIRRPARSRGTLHEQ
ncbi:hypothetical protein [uncultured Sphingomonas sp.]|uniref:hypothetical protein n=1 Tax=uncultured Sphingomonas sp. TaxID=158754 RepID=UPI0035CBB480